MSVEPAPLTTTAPAVLHTDDALFSRLAREIAMDILPLDKVLETLGIPINTWDFIRNNSRFKLLLASEIEAWHGATNTAERVRLKSLAFIEESLPEFFARVHDTRETLAAKTEVLKAVSKLAGLGNTSSDVAGAGERFSVTINMGAEKTVRIEKDVTPVGNGRLIDNAELA